MTNHKGIPTIAQPEDVAKIVVPDGHLEEILKEIFRRMEIPYPETNGRGESYGVNCVYEMKNGRKQKMYLSVHRPQDSPEYVKKGYFIAGISGLDCWIDSLNIPLLDDNVEDGFRRELKKIGLIQLIDLEYRPSSVVIVVHKDSPIQTMSEFEDVYSNGDVVHILGSEFITMPKNYARKTGIRVQQYKFTRGKTESMIRDGIADAIIEIAETGNRIKGNDGKIIGPIISKSTPRIIARLDALENGYTDFLIDFRSRIENTVEKMKNEEEYRKIFKNNPLQEELQEMTRD